MRGTETTSCGNSRPAGVAALFQVSRYKIEPSKAVFSCNLLPKDADRSALLNEPVEGRPQVPLISKPDAFACRAERLAWAGSGPDGTVVGPSCLAQGVGPHANSGEEVALSVSIKFTWYNIFYAPLVNHTISNMSRLY
jgi:hypothetical protein